MVDSARFREEQAAKVTGKLSNDRCHTDYPHFMAKRRFLGGPHVRDPQKRKRGWPLSELTNQLMFIDDAGERRPRQAGRTLRGFTDGMDGM